MSEKDKVVFNRRDFLRGASLLTVGGILAACGSTAPGSSDAGGGEDADTETASNAADTASDDAPAVEGVEIQYWVFWGQLESVRELFEESEALQEALGPNTWDFRTGAGGDAGLTAVAGGTPPDIGTLGNYLDFMARGAVIPIDDYVASSSIVQPDKFIEGNWATGQYEGQQYGVPGNECFVRRGLNYNVRMVEEAGLDPDTPPVTWDEVFAWHEALTKFDGAGNLIQIGLDPYDAEGGVGPGNDGWFLTDSWGFDFFNPDTGEFNLDNEGMAEGLEVMGEFVRLVGPDNLTGMRAVEGQGTWGGAYNAEVQAMIIEGYWHPGETFNEVPEVSEVNRSTWVPVPESRRGSLIQFGGGHVVQLFKDAEHQAEAWPIAEWLQSTSCCDIIFENIGWLPAYKSYFESADGSKFPGLQFYFDSVTDANQWPPYIICEIQNFIAEKYSDVREAVYRDEMTGAEAAAQMQEDAEKEWVAAGFG